MQLKLLVQRKYEVVGPYVGAGSVEDRLLENGFLVVMEQGKYSGVLTVSDVAKNPHRLVIDCLSDKPCVDYGCELEVVLKLMRKTRSFVLPVFKAGQFIGVVTRVDIADFLSKYRKGLERELVERERIAKSLKESEEKWRSLVESSPNIIVTVDREGTILFINRAVTGRAVKHLVGTSVYQYIAPQHRDALRKNVQNTFQTGESNQCQVTSVGPGSTPRWLEVHIGPVRSNGDVGAAILVAADITERKKAEEQIEKYRFMVESASDAIFFKDVQSRYIVANSKTLEAFGLPREQVIGKNDFEIMSDRSEAQANIEDDRVVFSTGRPKHVAKRMTGADGQERWFQAIKTPHYDDKGNIVGLVGIARDITESKMAEQELYKAEAKYRTLVEQIPAVTYIAALDRTSTTLYVSPQIETLIGFSPKEYEADSDIWRKRLHPEDRDRVLTQLQQCHADGRPFYCEYRVLARDGRVVWFRDEAVLVRDSSNRPLFFQGVMFDITERKRVVEALEKARSELEFRVEQRTQELAEANQDLINEINERKRIETALREAEERFRSIFENTVIGLYRTTPDGRILLANPALVRMLGFTSFEELATRDLEVQGFDQEHSRSEFKKRLEKEGKIIGLESVWLKRDSTPLFVCESAVAVRDAQGEILYYEGTVEDISERKKAEQKLLSYQQQLRSLASELSLAEERLRHRLATDVHDHIGQNLAISKIKLEALRQSVSSPLMGQSLDEICRLISQAIESSRSLTFELSPPVLYELGFEAAIEWLVRKARAQHGLSANFRNDPRPKPLDDNVRVLLFQAVRELLVNVAKHAKASSVTVAIRRVGDEINVSVEDDGAGFSSSKIGAADYQKGGFGLFSIRERLRHIGGRLEVDSQPKKGTRLTLVVPVAENESAGAQNK